MKTAVSKDTYLRSRTAASILFFQYKPRTLSAQGLYLSTSQTAKIWNISESKTNVRPSVLLAVTVLK